ncbi:MAG TPA: DUF2846 domain-containing protein [Candidatus Acidoferrum sp.]|nr:DUF2846 domain-containing protein [Candidatus Acidoferrum sp.]
MNKRWLFFVGASLLGSLPALAQDQAAAALTAAGCGPTSQSFDVKTTDSQHPVSQPEAGKALVYFAVNYYAAPTMRMGVDGTWMGANNGRSYFFFQVAPGEHNFCVAWQSRAYKKTALSAGEAIHLTVEAGKTYYLRLTSDNTRLHLELSDEAEGHFLVGTSLYATSQPKK